MHIWCLNDKTRTNFFFDKIIVFFLSLIVSNSTGYKIQVLLSINIQRRDMYTYSKQ